MDLQQLNEEILLDKEYVLENIEIMRLVLEEMEKNLASMCNTDLLEFLNDKEPEVSIFLDAVTGLSVSLDELVNDGKKE